MLGARAPLSALVVAALFALPVRAQTAADKATARQAATEGIELYRAGKYADALDRLRRAQELYSAPVHLLYIARSQEKLNQLVEAEENYQLLDRYSLPSGAPPAWVSAVSDGQKELAALEPRIPKLRVVAAPTSLPEPKLTIDGADVSAAVIGIARPVDPGAHHVELVAKGYAPASADVTLAEHDSKDVELRLVAASADSTVTTPDVAVAAKSDATPAKTDEQGGIGYLLGLRLGLGIPTGGLFSVNGSDLDTSKVFDPGGALEFHLGVRFARYFTPVLYVEGESLGTKDYSQLAKSKSGSASSIGLGIIVGTPPDKIGGFGEFELVFANTFALNQSTVGTNKECDVTATGGALRFGGGAVFPVSNWLNITPVLMATIGRFTKTSTSATCPDLIKPPSDPGSDVPVHGMVLLGVGGDFILGRSR